MRGFPLSTCCLLILLLVPDLALAVDGSTTGACSLADATAQFESGGDSTPLDATNPGSTSSGRYQMTYAALVDAGYIDGSQSTQPPSGAGSWDTVVWTGRGGVTSREDYLSNEAAQQDSFNTYVALGGQRVSGTWDSSTTVNGVQMTAGGAAMAAYMLGAGNFQTWAASGFTSAGLSAALASANGFDSVEAFQAHLAQRVAAGGCADMDALENLEDGGGLVQDLPEIFLMPWESTSKTGSVLPGRIRSNAQ